MTTKPLHDIIELVKGEIYMNYYIVETLGNWEFEDRLLADPYAKWTREEANIIHDHQLEYAYELDENLELDLPRYRGAYTSYESIEDIEEEYELDREDLWEVDVQVLEHEGTVLVYKES